MERAKVDDSVVHERRFRVPRWAYWLVGILSAVAPLVFAVATDMTSGRATSSDAAFASVGALFLAVLSYPMGVVGTLCVAGLQMTNLVTPTESVALCAPIFLALGHLQWYLVIPRLFSSR